AVFDVGASFYWLAPTAPPWYVAPRAGRADEERSVGGAGGGAEAPGRRRMGGEGGVFWGDGWGPLYRGPGGKPLAAMPSLHFATSMMAALLLAEVGPLAGALGLAYTLTLAFALVYLGEHYVVDLLGGAALTGAVRRLGPRAGPALSRAGRTVARLEALAHEAS